MLFQYKKIVSYIYKHLKQFDSSPYFSFKMIFAWKPAKMLIFFCDKNLDSVPSNRLCFEKYERFLLQLAIE